MANPKLKSHQLSNPAERAIVALRAQLARERHKRRMAEWNLQVVKAKLDRALGARKRPNKVKEEPAQRLADNTEHYATVRLNNLTATTVQFRARDWLAQPHQPALALDE